MVTRILTKNLLKKNSYDNRKKLADYKDKNISFYDCYIDCTPIEEIEGCILENAKWCAYAVTDQYGHRYFTDEGIRGCCTGTFKIKNGRPVELITCPTHDALHYAAKLIKSNFKLDDIDEYDLYKVLYRKWYDGQDD